MSVAITPLLVSILLPSSGGMSLDALGDVAPQILLPFGLGQALRPWIGRWLLRQPVLTAIVDRGSMPAKPATESSRTIWGLDFRIAAELKAKF